MRGNNSDAFEFLTFDAHWLRGVRRPVAVTAPAAQTEWTINVPSGVLWRILGGSADFTADATVGNRTVGILASMYGTPVYVTRNSFTVTASGNCEVVYQQGVFLVTNVAQITATDTLVPVPAPPIFLPAGSTIQSATAFIGAADAYSDIVLVVEEITDTDVERSQRRFDERAELLRALESKGY